MRNPELYGALSRYCKAGIKVMNEKLEAAGPVPGGRRWEGFGGEPEAYWRRMVRLSGKSLQLMGEYDGAVEALEGDEAVGGHLGQLVGNPWSGTLFEGVGAVADAALIGVVEGQPEGSMAVFRKGAFDRIYGEIEDYFYGDYEEYTFVAGLHGFRMDEARLKLGPEFAIVRAPGGGWAKWAGLSGLPLTLRGVGLVWGGREEWALVLRSKVPKVIGERERGVAGPDGRWLGRLEFDRACSALRLFKSGMVGYEWVVFKPSRWSAHRGTEAVSGLPRRPFAEGYVLGKRERPAFQAFWRRYRAPISAVLDEGEVPLRRFNLAYERERPEDRLIDLVVGLEALLVGGERGAVSYKLALRGGMLLGKTGDEREQVRGDLREAYKLRSRMMHGDKKLGAPTIAGEPVALAAFVDRVEHYLRLAIRELLKGAGVRTGDQLREALDRRAVRG